ncbi:MAG TPA: SDR family oxidoreductase [Acidothermaceae bacterium]|nr:SDR family oxidoreductase [Acidothermaceae bacterium]
MSEVLSDAVVVVAGAGGGAGAAAVRQLAAAGATVVMADTSAERLDPLAEEVTAAGGRAVGYPVDLLDEAATKAWARSVVDRFGRVDGVVHLVGGWRGGKGIVESDLADWALLSDLLIRTVQHTTRAFHDVLRASPAGRFVLISAAAASRPTADNAAYAAAKAAAEAWTLAVADSFKGSQAAATVLVVKALLTPAMRAAKPEGKFTGFTDVEDLAEEIVSLWDKPAAEVNGARLWLTN